jgi:hypothetical protein
MDFYYLKNIAGRRLVGLRWWNEVDPQTGDSHWVFESADPETRTINPTDRRFFWLALYAQPALWIVLGAVAIIKIVSFMALTPLWITLVSKFSLSVRAARSTLTIKKSSPSSSLSPTPWRFRGVIALVRLPTWLRVPCTLAVWQGMLRLV